MSGKHVATHRVIMSPRVDSPLTSRQIDVIIGSLLRIAPIEVSMNHREYRPI